MPRPQSTPDAIVRDIAALLSGIQVPMSLLGPRALGAAWTPIERLRDGLGLFGYPDAQEIEEALRKALGLPAEVAP